jgi:hypothetical protein
LRNGKLRDIINIEVIFVRIYQTLGGGYLIHGREFPMGTVVLQLDNGVELYCSNFNTPRKYDLQVLVYIPHEKKWLRCMMKNEYTEQMWQYYRKCSRKKRSHYNSKKKHQSNNKKVNGSKRVKVPDSVRWAMQHPFQGGGCSPR